MEDLEAVVTSLTRTVLSADPDPFVIRLLATAYRESGRSDVFEVLGAAIAAGLDRARLEADAGERAQWLIAMAEATTVSDDPLVREAIQTLLDSCTAPLAAAGIEASLRGAVAIGDSARLATAVDDLERLVARAYEPGEGVVLDRARGVRPADQVTTASALLTAYEITERLPYSMLAEELMQTTPPDQWPIDDVRGACEAARVLCRLAALNEDEGYRAAAVTARDAHYRSAVHGLLHRYDAQRFDSARDAATYGLALAQWLNLH